MLRRSIEMSLFSDYKHNERQPKRKENNKIIVKSDGQIVFRHGRDYMYQNIE